MQEISGVSIKLSFNGRPLTTGFLGKLTPYGQLSIEVRVPAEPKTYAITVDGKKNITLKKNYAPANSSDAIYGFEAQTKKALDGNSHVEYPENNMRLIRVNPDGNVEIWQIAIVSQNSMFFLITEKTYDKCCFQNEHGVVCPQFKHRPKLTKFLKELLKDHVDCLPSVAEYKKKTITADGLKPGTGRVRWWNSAQGFGAIITPEGLARVHWYEVANKEGRLIILNPGQLVGYEGLREPKQTKDRNTTFQKEAFGVTLL